MGYRLLCDENAEPETVEYLEADGHDAAHVSEVLSTGADDEQVAAYAREDERVLVTNDTDFLNEERCPDIKVFHYTNNRTSAYELAEMIARVESYIPAQSDLPKYVHRNSERW